MVVAILPPVPDTVTVWCGHPDCYAAGHSFTGPDRGAVERLVAEHAAEQRDPEEHFLAQF